MRKNQEEPGFCQLPSISRHSRARICTRHFTGHRHFTRHCTRQLGIVLGNLALYSATRPFTWHRYFTWHFTRHRHFTWHKTWHYFCCARANNGHLVKSWSFLVLYNTKYKSEGKLSKSIRNIKISQNPTTRTNLTILTRGSKKNYTYAESSHQELFKTVL